MAAFCRPAFYCSSIFLINPTTAMNILKYCLWIPFLCAVSTFAQPSPGKDITGKVINERGEPLANANVSIKNGRGTVTNARGQFLLKNVTPNDILQISFVG